MMRTAFSMLSPKGARARLSILIFHRVLPRQDPLFPSEVHAAVFDRMCSWVAAWFNVLPLDIAVAQLQDGSLPDRALAITFDDGYADNFDVALPILARHGLPATFYIATGFLDGGRMWNDTVIESVRLANRPALELASLGVDGLGLLPLGSTAQRQAAIAAILGRIKYRTTEERLRLVAAIAEHAGAVLPNDLMMRSDQVLGLHRAGMQIGAHTVSHPILAKLNAAHARREIGQSKQALEALLGERVGLFAYPNGVPGKDYSDETLALVRELGFDSAVTTGWGAARRGTNVFALPRFSPWDRTRSRYGLRLLRNLWTP